MVTINKSFTYSGYFCSTSSSPPLVRGASNDSTDIVSEFHAEAPQATANEELAQGIYMAARAGFEPATFRQKAPNLSVSYHAQNMAQGYIILREQS